MPRTSRLDATIAATPRASVAILGAFAALVSACGARTSMSSEASGGAGSGEGGATSPSAPGSTSDAIATSTASAGGGEGGGGQGGAPAACETLVWAGEPVFIEPIINPLARFPSLIVLDEGSVAVVFEAFDRVSTLVSSTVTPWSAWPPPTSPVNPHHDTFSRDGSSFAVTEGDEGDFMFATTSPVEGLEVGRAGPGGGSEFFTLPALTGTARFIVRASGAVASPLLLGHGPPNGLVVSWIASFAEALSPTTLGPFGCADRPVATDATRFGGGFAVASTADAPLDDCLDPDLPGPPLAAQVHLFDRQGALLGADAFEREAPIVDVRVAERPGGGWLATTAEGDTSTVIQPISADGTIDAFALHFGLYEGGDFEIRGWSSARVPSGLAVLQIGPIPESPTGAVVLQLFDGAFEYVAHTISSPLTSLAPSGRPALLVSPDGRSFLVAFEHAPQEPGASGSTIALMRADCAPL